MSGDQLFDTGIDRRLVGDIELEDHGLPARLLDFGLQCGQAIGAARGDADLDAGSGKFPCRCTADTARCS